MNLSDEKIAPAVWAAAVVLHEAGCSLPGCVHTEYDVAQGDHDLAADMVLAAAPHIQAAERKRIAEGTSTGAPEDERLGLYRLAAADGAIAERERTRHALLDCRDCGKIHERRAVPKVPENMTGASYADPADGHPYALTLHRQVVEDVLAVAELLELP